ncbi:PLP-dependent aminotransferase family protein [Reichenbachiella agarivorans]|uniref:PLP-dependent aminotransferase family protein n=1 Tax=Reichenbachiella agarivorans TaxID=2979464 RepID=A0ABY6CLF0_9BACT|nr:PLP-dependent aminotransferase family protein [Reichenbachiella agarivorans]UXP31338.1 PLP-dependent aminotransferase family protein [Reichenbachiella agarivorans]
MLPWKSIITINPNSKRAIYLQLADAFVLEIMNGRIATGSKLPSSRLLAETLTLNRKTILLAYDELMAQGWTEVHPSRGTFVKKDLPVTQPKGLNRKTAVSKPNKSTITANKTYQITEGTPDYRIAPIELLYKTAKSLTKGILAKSVLTGNHFEGEINLRNSLCKYLHETRALNPSIDEIMITRGSQMSIFLALSSILHSGDQVIVGKLNYGSANRTIQHLGGKLVEVDLTPEGLDIEQIEQAVQLHKIKAIYISPHHHYPTTVTMPIEHRLRLLELSIQHDFYILEDDYDFDYHYNGSPILPIASIDQGQRVIYIGSFSKIFAPSIRMGYMYADPNIIDQCRDIRKLIDRRGDPVLEKALSILIEEKEIHRSIKKAVNIYRHRRDLFCHLLKQKLGDEIQFNIPDGGMAIWATFKNIQINDLIKECKKVNLHLDIDTYHETNKCRLGFASMNNQEIAQNLNLFCYAIVQLLKKN